jgi:hypothetical protein
MHIHVILCIGVPADSAVGQARSVDPICFVELAGNAE